MAQEEAAVKMDTTITKVVYVASAVLYALLVLTIFLRKKSILKRAGKCVFSARPRSAKFSASIIVCAPFIMLFSAFVDLHFYFKWMLCAVALLATEIAVREASTLHSSGVYENGVVTEGEVILFTDICVAKKGSETGEIRGDCVAELEVRGKGMKRIAYADEGERDAVLKAIFGFRPQLKRGTV